MYFYNFISNIDQIITRVQDTSFLKLCWLNFEASSKILQTWYIYILEIPLKYALELNPSKII